MSRIKEIERIEKQLSGDFSVGRDVSEIDIRGLLVIYRADLLAVLIDGNLRDTERPPGEGEFSSNYNSDGEFCIRLPE